MPEPMLPEEIEWAMDRFGRARRRYGEAQNMGNLEESDAACIALRAAITAALAAERERCAKAVAAIYGPWDAQQDLPTNLAGWRRAAIVAIRSLAAPEERQRGALPGEGT